MTTRAVGLAAVVAALLMTAPHLRKQQPGAGDTAGDERRHARERVGSFGLTSKSSADGRSELDCATAQTCSPLSCTRSSRVRLPARG